MNETMSKIVNRALPFLFCLLAMMSGSTATVKKPFYVNCLEENITTSRACELHIRNTLVNYVNAGGYSKDSLPVADDADMPFKAYAWMTFNSINDVSVMEGKVTIAVFLDVVWYDPFLRWDTNLTLGIGNVYIDPKLVYKPDFILYNAVGSFESMLSTQVIEWYADGGMWNSRQGQITFNCEFNLMNFPADVQICTAKFASFIYPAEYLQFLAPLPFLEDDIPTDLDTTIVLPTFQSSEWKVSDLKGREYNEELYGGEYSFMSWSITLNRYPQFYMATAVYPETIVSIIAILGFWVTDIPSRLSLSMTALLTILAVQWSIAETLPVSREFTWLSKFSVISIVIVALCVAQACIVAFMRKHSSMVPQWVTYVISLSTAGRAWYRFLLSPFVAGAKEIRRLSNIVLPSAETMEKLSEMQSSDKHSTVHPFEQLQTEEPDIERTLAINDHKSHRPKPNWGALVLQNNHTADSIASHQPSVSTHTDTSTSANKKKLRTAFQTVQKEIKMVHMMHKGLSRRFSVDDTEVPDHIKNYDATWSEGANALDDVCCILFPLAYALVIIVMVYQNPGIFAV